jgi:hypothetical protein
MTRYALARRPKVARPRPTEADEQATVVTWFRMTYPKYAGCLVASGNGLHIGGKTAGQKAAHWANFKRTGGVDGLCDLFLRVPSGGAHGMFIEMKRQHATRSDVTDEQFADIGLSIRMGYAATWCAGAHEAVAAIEAYLEGSQ